MASHAIDLEARREAREATRAVGELVREVADSRKELGGKVDALISDVRELAAIQRDQVTHVRRIDGTLSALLDAFRKLRTVEDASRRKLESFADLDAVALGHMTEREQRRRRFWRSTKLWAKRAALAVVLGAATVLGGSAAVSGLRACGHAPSVPIEVSP